MNAQKGLQFLKQVVDASVKTRCFESVLRNASTEKYIINTWKMTALYFSSQMFTIVKRDVREII